MSGNAYTCAGEQTAEPYRQHTTADRSLSTFQAQTERERDTERERGVGGSENHMKRDREIERGREMKTEV